MKVLVTGANGFLASNIIRELLDRGYQVKGMLRKGSNQLALKGLDCEFVFGNITVYEDVLKACNGCDVVIHAAANTSQASLNFDQYVPVNIEATEYILQASIQSRCKRLIFVSTANTIGYGSAMSPGREDNRISPVFQNQDMLIVN
ncbi:MAG: NAD-dependent epimerase/dehydratase family protein [Bacteroidales bacterium]|nr:NAD-dependent epimerase/dehydratase family protein [Bacteroidales bacterium]